MVSQGFPHPPPLPAPVPHQHLQHHVGARFDIQDARGPKWLKAGVRVVGEGGPVEGAGCLHMVQQETKLIRVLALGPWLGPPREDARGLTQHGSVVDNLARLCGQRRAVQHMRPCIAGAGAGRGQLALTLVVSMPRYLARTRGSWTVNRWVPLTVMAVLPLGTGRRGPQTLSPNAPSPALESYEGCSGSLGPLTTQVAGWVPGALCQEDPAPSAHKGPGLIYFYYLFRRGRER